MADFPPEPAEPPTLLLDEQQRYLLFDYPTPHPSFRVGLPIRTSSSGHLACFLDGRIPIITVNLAQPRCYLTGRRGTFASVGVYTATFAENRTSIIVAPPEAQAYHNGRYVISTNCFRFDGTGIRRPSFLHFAGFNRYLDTEKRSLKMSWDPYAVSGVITKEYIQSSFSRVGHFVETIFMANSKPEEDTQAMPGEARVVFKSAYSVGSIMCGLRQVDFELGDGQKVILRYERRVFKNDGPNRRRKIFLTWDEEEDITQYDLFYFFQRYGRIDSIYLEETDAVIVFASMEPVREILGGEEIVSFYIGNKAVRVYS